MRVDCCEGSTNRRPWTNGNPTHTAPGSEVPRASKGPQRSPRRTLGLGGRIDAGRSGPLAGPDARRARLHSGAVSKQPCGEPTHPPIRDPKPESDLSRCQPSWFFSTTAQEKLAGANPSHLDVNAFSLTSAAAVVSTSRRALCACHKIHRSQAGRTLVRWPRCHEAAVSGRDPHQPPGSTESPAAQDAVTPSHIDPFFGPFEVAGAANVRACVAVRCLTAAS